MSLISLSVVNRKYDDLNSAKTYGLNTEKVGNFYYDPDANNGSGGTVFFYMENEGRKSKSVRYETSDSYATLENKLLDAATQRRRINLQVVAKGITDEEYIKDVNIDANRIVRVWDNDAGTYGYVEFENGAFETLRYKTEELLSEIISEISTSVSTST